MSQQITGETQISAGEEVDHATTIFDAQPWNKPWWQYTRGRGGAFFYIILIHVLALAGVLLFPLPSWRVIAIAFVFAALGGVGATVCLHRCLAHRALRLNPLVENFLIFWTVFNASGAPITWVAKHRHHHAKADTPEDVSSPRYGGFWWAHLKWVYQWNDSDARRWCPDLDKPRYRIWRPLQVPIILLSLFCGLFLGWEGFFWIGAIRLVYILHMQMVVNSLLHMTPDLPEGEDTSRNIWWLGPLQIGAWGENWHRNHHGDQNAARFGRKWWQVDFGWYVIRGLQLIKLATNVRPPRSERRAVRG